MLLKARSLSLDRLIPGKYRVVVTVREPVSGAALASTSAPLTLEDDAPQHPFYMLSHLQGSGSNGVAAYIRGLAAMAFQDRTAAAQYFQEAIERNPANASAKAALASLK